MSNSLKQTKTDWGQLDLSCPNTQDGLVIAQLASAPLRSLPIDKFARVLCANQVPSDAHISILRHALIKTYREAAKVRHKAKPTKAQLASARKALGSGTKLLGHLDDVAPPTQRGLWAAFGSPFGDIKGLHESNVFDSECRQIRLKIGPLLSKLEQIIDDQSSKPSQAGERKKRLRVLVEVLFDWWSSVTGKLPAPYVYAKRLEGYPSIVIGRRGDFVSLAKALLCEIDQFSESEVIATVTNVHEDCSRAKNKIETAQ